MTPKEIIIEKQFEPTVEEQNFLNFLISYDCPYYIQKAYTRDEDGNMLMWSHTLMARDKNFEPVEGRIASALYEHARKIFMRFCNENNIKVNTIFRAAVNATSHLSVKHSRIHTDHEGFKHNNFLLYINDVGGSTYLFDDKEKVIGEIVPAKNKVAIFNGCPHAQGFGKQGEYRFVMVFTFA